MSKDFESLTSENQRLVRVGYYSLNNQPCEEKIALGLTNKELRIYHTQGLKVERQKKRLGYVGFAAFLLLIAGTVAYVAYSTHKISEHYSKIVPINVCKRVIDRIELFSDDIYATGYQPTELNTEVEENTSSCSFYLKGERADKNYRAFITASVDKTAQKQKDTTKDADAVLEITEPYNVFAWEATKNYYSVKVSGGIEPKDTNLDTETSDTIIKLITLLAGTALVDELPENANVSDL